MFKRIDRDSSTSSAQAGNAITHRRNSVTSNSDALKNTKPHQALAATDCLQPITAEHSASYRGHGADHTDLQTDLRQRHAHIDHHRLHHC